MPTTTTLTPTMEAVLVSAARTYVHNRASARSRRPAEWSASLETWARRMYGVDGGTRKGLIARGLAVWIPDDHTDYLCFTDAGLSAVGEVWPADEPLSFGEYLAAQELYERMNELHADAIGEDRLRRVEDLRTVLEFLPVVAARSAATDLYVDARERLGEPYSSGGLSVELESLEAIVERSRQIGFDQGLAAAGYVA